MDQAEASIPYSIVPVAGLRRDNDGTLTADSLRTVMDGLRSRGLDPGNADDKKKILAETQGLICTLNNQYQFLLKDLLRRLNEGAQVTTRLIEAAKDKNRRIQDLIGVVDAIKGERPFDQSNSFLEGWQSGSGSSGSAGNTQQLQREMDALSSNDLAKMRQHMVTVTEEKNKVASNYLALYGFLNLVAVGLLIYVSSSR
jgi:hypothetical protein